MDAKDKKRLREAFLAAAQSPAADKCLQGTSLRIADMFRNLADSKTHHKVMEDDIRIGRITLDRFIEELQKQFPPAPAVR